MSLPDIKKFYDDLGLETIPLPFNRKDPPPEGWKTKTSAELWDDIKGDCNVGIKLGQVADLESDDLISEANIGKICSDFGIVTNPRCRSRRGLHRFVKVTNAPNDLNFTNWTDDVGKGEARIKNCYSVVPDSEYKNFKYFWEQESWKHFNNLPEIDWSNLSNFTKYSERPPIISLLPRYLRFDPDPWIPKTFKYLKTASRSKDFSIDSHYWPSRSEAEAAIVLRLDTCGFTYTEIENLFESEKPLHYWDLGTHRHKYLVNSYEQAQSLSFRPKLSKAYNLIGGNAQIDKVLRVLISMSHQLNSLQIFATYEQLSKFIGIDPNSKAGPAKAVKKLESEGKIIIKKGRSRVQGIGGYPTTYNLAPLVNDL